MLISTEEAIDKAIRVANSYGYPFVRVVSVRKIGTAWIVKLDVGAFRREYKVVKIDSNGNLIGFGG